MADKRKGGTQRKWLLWRKWWGWCVCVGGGGVDKWQQSKKNVLGESDAETVDVGEITEDGQIQIYITKQNKDETFPFFIWNILKW